MSRPLHTSPRRTLRQRHMPPRASPRRTPRPLHTSPRHGTRLRKLPHRATRRRALPRHTLHPLHALPRRVMPRRQPLRRAAQPRTLAPRARHKRLAQRRGRLRIPQRVRAALSPQAPRHVAAATPRRDKTRRRNPTRLRDKV
jgi:hypothetical protein